MYFSPIGSMDAGDSAEAAVDRMTDSALPPPRVTVVVVTYNHKKYIRQSLESVLDQHTDFGFEILISEDCSTDGTRELVLAYAREHPVRIRLLLSEQNIRSNAVVRRGIEAARGTYIAFVDGDDYWTDPGKLRKQVDFLDEHPECSLCFHNALVVPGDSTRSPQNWTPKNHPPFSSFEDIWMGNFIPMCSTMFRRSALEAVPAWYDDMFPITDWPLHILAARSGRLGYLNEVMGVYRQHSGGLYSSLTEEEKLRSTLEFYRRMNANLKHAHDSLVRTAISNYFFEWAEEYLARGDLGRARACFKQFVLGKPFNRRIRLRRVLKVGAKLLAARSLEFP